MISYTKKNVRTLSLILTTVLFLLFHLICLYFQKSNEKNYSKQIYSTAIPNSSTNFSNYYLSKNKENIEYKALNKSNENLENNTKNNQKSLSISKKPTENYKVSVLNENVSLNKNNNLSKNNSEESNSIPKTQTQILEENKDITWRIQIPKINLDAHIKEGITNSVLLSSIGHFEQTSKWQGNVALAAHNRGYQCNFFQNIKDLQIGDEIIYTTANNKKVYKVQINKIILETDWSYLQNTKDNRITLITCEENRKEYRRCVQAVEIANYKIK